MSGGGHGGRRYIIAGGTSGMGYATAVELALHGAIVAVIGRDTARAQTAAQRIATLTGGAVSGIGIDRGGMDAAIGEAAAQLGGIDGLAVTAGPMGVTGSVEDLSDRDWIDSFESQVMTVVRACRAALPLLRARGGGRIVTTAAYSIRSQKSFLPHYAAMKSAVASITKNIAKFGGKDGITANCVAPGAIDTEALDVAAEAAMRRYGLARAPALARAMDEDWGMRAALGRIGQPREVGELMAFLLSPQAAYMTGALINIDGGTDF